MLKEIKPFIFIKEFISETKSFCYKTLNILFFPTEVNEQSNELKAHSTLWCTADRQRW